MRRYLLDTGIASDFINCRHGVPNKVADVFRRGDRVGIGTPVLGELLAGIELSDDPARHHKRLAQNLGNLIIWPFDANAADWFGRVFAQLRRQGRPMQQVDIQLAAMAFSLGSSVVVTKDSDFSAISGLDIEDWSKP